MSDKCDNVKYHVTVTDKTDSRTALLRAMELVVLEKGSRNLSLREVARTAGMSHAAPGHHFGDKEGMIAAFAREGFARFAETMAAGDPDNMRGSAYIRFARENPAHFDVMFRSGLDTSKYSGLAEGAHGTFGALVQSVAEAQAAGIQPDAPTEILALRAWSLVHGLASLIIDRQLDDVVDEDEIDEVIQAILDSRPR